MFVKVNVTVNCSCGNRKVSKDYGLFITYPLSPKHTLESIAKDTKLDAELLQRYNPGVNFSQGSGLVFIPGNGLVFILLSLFVFLFELIMGIL
jgi:chitin elicitor receptor kinase 1